MTWLLDTNTCVNYLRHTEGPVRRRLRQLPLEQVAVCSVVKAELLYGALRSSDPERIWANVLTFLEPLVSFSFDDRAAQYQGRLRAVLAKRGEPIGPDDLMIAAIALANDLTLVTHNLREFNRVPGLKLADWEASPPVPATDPPR